MIKIVGLILSLFCYPVLSLCGDLRVDPPGNVEKALPGVIQNASGKPFYPEWWGNPPNLPNSVSIQTDSKCINCHVNHSMDQVHALDCIKCHRGNPAANDKNDAHIDLIKNPGDLEHATATCGQCHPEEVRRVRLSPMALSPRMINHTRFSFGAQNTVDPINTTVQTGESKQLPTFSQSGNLGDDLLRRSCLRCHLYTRGSERFGEHRGTGCSACHVPYPNTANGSKRHMITKNLGITPCLKCHNSNHVGADFVGLYEKDFDRGFRSPFVEGRQSGRIYGSEQHFLIGDIHYRRGMICTDCHILDEIHGSGKSAQSTHRNSISCEGCHIKGDHPGVLSTDQDLILLRTNRKIPVCKTSTIPHSVKKHLEKLRCSACHAAWSFQDYGFHLMLEERADYWKWSTLAGQNDPQIQALLIRNIGTEVELVQPEYGPKRALPDDMFEKPTMFDWLTRETSPGAWFRGFTQRTWSRPPLGVDSKGKVSIMRPIFQYVLSHVDEDATIRLDRVIPTTGSGTPALIFNPYAPHTIHEKGRACQECHGNTKAAGLGEALISIEKHEIKPLWPAETQIPGHEFRWEQLVTSTGDPVQFSSHPGAGPLDAKTINGLLNPSNYFKAMWHRYLSGN